MMFWLRWMVSEEAASQIGIVFCDCLKVNDLLVVDFGSTNEFDHLL